VRRNPTAFVAASGVAVVIIGVGCALWARYRLVEVDGLEALCASVDSLRCSSRHAVIAAFQQHRLGGTALILAAVAWGLGLWGAGAPRRGARRASALLTLGALGIAGAGLVLYDADVSAVALVWAALGLRQWVAGDPGPIDQRGGG